MYKNYNSAKCNVCFTLGDDEKCDKFVYCDCKLVRYCSERHKQEDYTVHKSFCQCVKRIMHEWHTDHVFKINPRNEADAESRRKLFEFDFTLVKSILNAWLKRPLFQHEDSMLSKPLLCRVCFDFSTKLFACPKCNNILYCSEKHRKYDEKHHQQLCDTFLIQYELRPDYEVPQLLHFQNNFDWKDNTKSEAEFPNNLFELLSITNNRTYKMSPETGTEFDDYMKVSKYSFVATILYIFRNQRKPQVDNQKLIIHIVGVETEFDFFNENACFLLLRWLPNINHIVLHFIGPELVVKKNERYEFANKTKSVQLNFHPLMYHSFTGGAQKSENEKPHLIISYNCGFAEFASSAKDSWPKSIKEMLKFRNVPIAFTSYTHGESVLDLGVVQKEKSDVNVTAENIDNPFKDHCPLFNWLLSNADNEIYYSNGFLCILYSS